MNPKQLKKRKKTIYDVICSKSYMPMRAREIAILLDIPREKRKDLQDVLDSLMQENKITMDRRGRYMKKKAFAKGSRKRRTVGHKTSERNLHQPSQGFWLCGSGR